MSNLGAYQTTVEDMKRAGGPDIYKAMIRQEGYNDGAHDMLVNLAVPLGIGLVCACVQVWQSTKSIYNFAKEKRQLTKEAVAEAEEKLTQLYSEELNKEDVEKGGNE